MGPHHAVRALFRSLGYLIPDRCCARRRRPHRGQCEHCAAAVAIGRGTTACGCRRLESPTYHAAGLKRAESSKSAVETVVQRHTSKANTVQYLSTLTGTQHWPIGARACQIEYFTRRHDTYSVRTHHADATPAATRLAGPLRASSREQYMLPKRTKIEDVV